MASKFTPGAILTWVVTIESYGVLGRYIQGGVTSRIPYWDRFDNGISVIEAVPIRTETLCKRTEAVHKWCKDGVRLQQAESVLCPCVRAIFPVYIHYKRCM